MRVAGVLIAASVGVALIGFAALSASNGDDGENVFPQAASHSSGVPGLSGNVENPTATPTATPIPPTPIPQVPWDQLRVWSDGDSTSYFMTIALLNSAGDRGATLVQPGPDYALGSRLSDWLAWLPGEMATYNPNVVVLMVGGNEASGCSISLDAWRAQVAQTMDMMQDRLFIWVGQPTFDPVLRPDMAGCVQGLNQVSLEEANARDWVEFVDAFAASSDGNGGYTDYGCHPLGQCGQTRAGDGVHFTSFGGSIVAFYALVAIDLAR